jgi:hypothetical protein
MIYHPNGVQNSEKEAKMEEVLGRKQVLERIKCEFF